MSLLDPLKELIMLDKHKEDMKKGVEDEPGATMTEPVDDALDPSIGELENIEPVMPDDDPTIKEMEDMELP